MPERLRKRGRIPKPRRHGAYRGVRFAVGAVFVYLCMPAMVFSQTPGTGFNPPVIEQPKPASADFPPWKDPLVDKLGYIVTQAIEEFGSPKEVYSLRDGTDPGQDSVVFFYDDFSYLFWWHNRVWQLRFDKRYQSSLFGVRMGQARAEVEKYLGKALYTDADELIYQLPDRGFPVRLRLMFEQGKLSDLYLYRADF